MSINYTDYEDLKNHLGSLVDGVVYDEDLEDWVRYYVACGYERELTEDVEYITLHLDCDPDRQMLAMFVAYVMNRDFGDPTGEKDIQWLTWVRDLMQSVLNETEEKLPF